MRAPIKRWLRHACFPILFSDVTREGFDGSLYEYRHPPPFGAVHPARAGQRVELCDIDLQSETKRSKVNSFVRNGVAFAYLIDFVAHHGGHGHARGAVNQGYHLQRSVPDNIQRGFESVIHGLNKIYSIHKTYSNAWSKTTPRTLTPYPSIANRFVGDNFSEVMAVVRPSGIAR